ncbi:MAG: glycosyltransferase family 39 protein [Desulfuromonadaceae bacterium]|nr:glycosyltransferase family 39 protein [Desulfuromonadaceae bacterium]
MRDLKAYAHNGNSVRWRDILLLILLCAVPFLLFLGNVPLIDPDEGRYAEIPREMLERGDFITPTLNYVKYFEKPPLLYWLNAASINLFGLNEFAARLPSALSGLATVLATYIIALRLFDRRTALFAALFLATAAGFVIQSRIILTDVLLTFCLTSALGAFIIAARRDKWHRDGAATWYLFYLFSAFSVLSKGLIGIVFPAGIIFFYILITSEWRILARMRLASGMLLFLAVAAPWFVVVSLQNPEFANFFFIHEHFERFTSTVHGRYQPFWFFLPVLAGTMLPWSFFIPGALGRAWRDRHHESGQAALFLLIWTLLIFLFFSISGSKLIPYMLPIFPPLAILIAIRFNVIFEGRGREIKLAIIILGGTLILLGALAIGYSHLPQVTAILATMLPSLAAPLKQFVTNAPIVTTAASVTVGLLFLAQGVFLFGSSGNNPARIVIVLCLGSFLLEILVPQLIMGSIAQTESPRELALKARSSAGPDTRIVTFGPMQAVSWYTGRRVLVTGRLDELEFGSKQGDQKAWFPDREALLKLWDGQDHILYILKKREFESLSAHLNPAAKVVQESGRLMLISNR